jgi:hypothetical protein
MSDILTYVTATLYMTEPEVIVVQLILPGKLNTVFGLIDMQIHTGEQSRQGRSAVC